LDKSYMTQKKMTIPIVTLQLIINKTSNCVGW
jgi:hypothetical protein